MELRSVLLPGQLPWGSEKDDYKHTDNPSDTKEHSPKELRILRDKKRKVLHELRRVVPDLEITRRKLKRLKAINNKSQELIYEMQYNPNLKTDPEHLLLTQIYSNNGEITKLKE